MIKTILFNLLLCFVFNASLGFAETNLKIKSETKNPEPFVGPNSGLLAERFPEWTTLFREPSLGIRSWIQKHRFSELRSLLELSTDLDLKLKAVRELMFFSYKSSVFDPEISEIFQSLVKSSDLSSKLALAEGFLVSKPKPKSQKNFQKSFFQKSFLKTNNWDEPLAALLADQSPQLRIFITVEIFSHPESLRFKRELTLVRKNLEQALNEAEDLALVDLGRVLSQKFAQSWKPEQEQFKKRVQTLIESEDPIQRQLALNLLSLPLAESWLTEQRKLRTELADWISTASPSLFQSILVVLGRPVSLKWEQERRIAKEKLNKEIINPFSAYFLPMIEGLSQSREAFWKASQIKLQRRFDLIVLNKAEFSRWIPRFMHFQAEFVHARIKKWAPKISQSFEASADVVPLFLWIQYANDQHWDELRPMLETQWKLLIARASGSELGQLSIPLEEIVKQSDFVDELYSFRERFFELLTQLTSADVPFILQIFSQNFSKNWNTELTLFEENLRSLIETDKLASCAVLESPLFLQIFREQSSTYQSACHIILPEERIDFFSKALNPNKGGLK